MEAGTIKAILICLIIVMTMLGALAGLFLKRASSNLNIRALLTNVNLYLGGGLYLIAAVINIVVLHYLDYSLVLPLTSITYIWTMIVSRLVLKETITSRKIAGVLCILAGAIVISIF